MSSYCNDNLVDMLRTFELTVAELYVTYACIFSAKGNGWIGFAEEEIRYAKWLSTLKGYSEQDIVSQKQVANSIQSAYEATEFVQNQIVDARNGKVNLVQALIIALEIENLIFERFFHPFGFANQKAEYIRRNHARETRGHREKIELWMDKVNNRKYHTA